MTDDNLLGTAIGAGVTLMIADKIFRKPKTRYVYRKAKRRKR